MLKHEHTARWLTATLAVVLLAAGLLLLPSTFSPAQAAGSSLNLSVTRVADTSVSLKWALSISGGVVRSYWITYGKVGVSTTYSKNVNRVTMSSVSGLTPGTDYWFQVKASTTSSPVPVSSNTVTVKTTGGNPPPPPTVPVAPTGLVVTAASTSSVSLRWVDNSSDETLFKIERAPVSTGSFVQINTVNAGSTSYSDVTVSASTTYLYRVCAYNLAGNSAYSNTVTATTPAPLPLPLSVPAAPTGLSATSVSTSSVTLQWVDNSSDETLFKIERAPGVTGSFVQINTAGAGSTSYPDATVSASTAYLYRVCAYNSGGNSGYSNTVSVTTPALPPPPPTKPAAPSGLVVKAVAWDKVDLQWIDNSSNETLFKIERAPASTGSFVQINTTGAGSATYSDTGVSASTAYLYRVCAYNLAGDSGYSNTVSVTTPAPPPTKPAAPTNLAVTASAWNKVDLQWADNSSDETLFKIERAPASTGLFVQINTAGAGSTSYPDATVKASTAYLYRVCAYNLAGNSAYSNTVSVTTPATPPVKPAAPANLIATTASDSEIDLTWTDLSSNETGFIVERSTLPTSGFTAVITRNAGATSHQDLNLTEDTEYYYRVCALNNGVNSDYTAIVPATTNLKAPSDLIASATSSNSISLTWVDNSQRETNYVVERSTNGLRGPWVSTTLPANTTSYLDQTCEPLTAYCYRVYASGSISDFSNVYTVTTPDVPIQPRWVGKTPVIGEAYWVAMDGPYAYVTSSTGLQVVDITDPSNPLVVGSVDMVYPYDVAAGGDGFVYVGAGKDLKVVDVQDPTSPAVVATLPMPDYAQGVCISGSKAYVACYTAGLVIIDIANPSSPRILGNVDTPGVASSVSVEGNTAVVADSTAALIMDVGNPTSPIILASVPTSDRAVDVQVSNRYAYIAATTAGMIVVDISNPASPRVAGVGSLSIFGAASGVALSGGYAFLASSSYSSTDNGLQVFGISNPAQPVPDGLFIPVAGRARGGIAVRDNVVCFASGVGGLATIGVDNPSSPTYLAVMPATMQSPSIAVEGSFLYALSYSPVQSRMYVYDVSTPESPVQISRLDLTCPRDIALDGKGHAFIGDNRSLKVVDLQDPTEPILLATLDLPDYAWGICVSGSKVYVACYTAGLVIVDIGNPYAPRIVGSVDTPGVAFAVAVAGNTAVVADATAVLTINVADPASPAIIGSFATLGQATDVQIANGYAYVAANTAGMLVMDIYKPGGAQLACAGVSTMFGAPSGIEVSGSRVFAASFSSVYADNGLQVFDISNPVRPIQSAYLSSPGRYRKAMAVAGRTIFLTDDKCLARIAQF